MEHKNLAFELLKKLLTEEVKVRKRKNMSQGKKFSVMLGNVIKRYHNNQLDKTEAFFTHYKHHRHSSTCKS